MDLDKLEAVTIACKGWGWSKSIGEEFGVYDDDGNWYCIGRANARDYTGESSDDSKVSAFIAAFNPAVALELIAEIKRLRGLDDDKGKDW